MELKTLCDMNGTSGDEKLVRRAVMEEAKKYTDDVKIDRMGNVIARKKGTDGQNRPLLLFSAHMDEVGFIITGATEEGLLTFKPVGGIDPRVCVSKHVKIGDEGLDGVIGSMAIHLQTKEMRARVLHFDELYIDIGAKSKEEALGKVSPATYAYFSSEFVPFGQGYVTAKALDDRAGCYNLLRILQGSYACDIVCAFVVQEEVGCRGALGAGFAIQPDIVINLECTASGDMCNVPETRKILNCGKGVSISFMDSASIADRKLYNTMMTLADEKGIPHQPKRGTTGGNDAGAYQRAGKGAKTCVLSVPCRYIHGPSSVCALSDIDAQCDLSMAFAQTL